MLVIAFVLLVIAGVIFAWAAIKSPGPDLPLQLIAWALIAAGLALWLYRSTNDLNGVLK